MGAKPILDACCGGRMFWFNKEHPAAVYGDIRELDTVACDGRAIRIAPDVKMDFRKMPFPDESFYLVILDPPHLDNAGENGWMAQKYGKLGKEWRADLKAGFDESMRVLKPYGTLIFKWNESRIRVSELIEIFGVEPLVGHRTLQSSKTIWMTFMKLPTQTAQVSSPGDAE